MPEPGATRHELLSLFNFEVKLTPSPSATEEGWTASAAFSEVTGLEINVEHTELREGGYHRGLRQLAGKTSSPVLVLKRGATLDTGFWDWIRRCTEASYPLPYIDGTIDVYEPGPATDGARDPARLARWRFVQGIATKVRMTDLNAGPATNVPIEELHIAHEGLVRELVS